MQHKIPYGISNFKKVITEGYVFIDKTHFIPRLEAAGNYLFLMRPRRFGKSLFLSMLWHYYDVAYKDDFETLFGNLWIGQHPTPARNRYPVLFLDFSGIDTDGGHDAILERINQKLDTYLSLFLQRYGYADAALQAVLAKTTPANKMEECFKAIRAAGQQCALLIDEYDHFANAILAEDINLFQQLMGKGGFVRAFYEVLKIAAGMGTLDKLFVTGVTPLMLDSLTSGFNIAENLSLHEDFNEVMGFTDAETASLLRPLVETCALNLTQLHNACRQWYNGYRFNLQAAHSVYNADMVLYFVKHFDRKRCQYPEQMLDENIASDYGKILKLFSIGSRDDNFSVLEALLNQGTVQASQQRKFALDKQFDHDDFISLLNYMGFITLVDKSLAGQIFAIPNQVIRELYFQYFKVELERRNQLVIPVQPLRLAIERLALYADFEPLRQEVQRILQLLSNRDALWMNEQHTKTLLLTLLHQLPVYFIHSEREFNKHYPDILLQERSPYQVNFQHLIEIKYSKKACGSSGWEAKKQEGITQVKSYLQLPEIAAMSKLAAWVVITDSASVDVVRVA